MTINQVHFDNKVVRKRPLRTGKKPLDPGIDSKVYNPSVHDNSDDNGFWRIGQLAKAAGVSPDTLRHYERKGVLQKPSRSANGYRGYAPDALDRVRLVRRALSVGFTLDELSQVLKVRDRGGAPCRRVHELATEKLSSVEAQLADMSALRDELRSTLQDWDARLARNSPGSPAGLLEALVSSEPTKPLRPANARRTLKRKASHD
jgi:DNA-binding transcriptional MerR regulator